MKTTILTLLALTIYTVSASAKDTNPFNVSYKHAEVCYGLSDEQANISISLTGDDHTNFAKATVTSQGEVLLNGYSFGAIKLDCTKTDVTHIVKTAVVELNNNHKVTLKRKIINKKCSTTSYEKYTHNEVELLIDEDSIYSNKNFKINEGDCWFASAYRFRDLVKATAPYFLIGPAYLLYIWN